MAAERNWTHLAERTSKGNSSSGTMNWRQLYSAAILELDPSKIAAQILDAEKAIAEREKELFHEDGESSREEKLALDDAMYFLKALRSTLKYNTSGSPYRGENHRMEAA